LIGILVAPAEAAAAALTAPAAAGAPPWVRGDYRQINAIASTLDSNSSNFQQRCVHSRSVCRPKLLQEVKVRSILARRCSHEGLSGGAMNPLTCTPSHTTTFQKAAAVQPRVAAGHGRRFISLFAHQTACFKHRSMRCQGCSS
jgi:hypothetical protein